MGKRKHPAAVTSQPAPAPAPSKRAGPAHKPTAATQSNAQRDRASHSPSSSSFAADDDGPALLSLKSSPSPSTSASSPPSRPAPPPSTSAASDEDDSDDELGLHIVERPSGHTSPSHPPTSPPSSSSPSTSPSSPSSPPFSPLHINRAYADQYEADKRRHELSKKAQRNKRKSEILALLAATPSAPEEREGEGKGEEEEGEEGEDNEDEDEEEDDEGALLTDELDVQIHATLNAIRRKDPAVYDPSTVFFTEEGEAKAGKEKTPADGPKVTVKDLLLQSLADDDAEEENLGEGEGEGEGRALPYVQEQAQLKAALVKAAQAGADANDADADGDEEDLFRVRISAPPPTTTSPSDDAPLPPAQFLQSFLSHQWWKASPSSLPSYTAIKGEPPPPLLHPNSDDDAEVERGEAFEAHYNQPATTPFHYLEEGGGEVHTWPRQVVDSVRRKDTRRKEERERRRKRKEEERRRRDEEVRKAKADKLRLLQQRMERIRQVAALGEGGGEGPEGRLAGGLAEGLEGDFDEAEHDRLMASLFDEEYYAAQVQEDDAAMAKLAEDEEDEGDGDGDGGATGQGRRVKDEGKRRPMSYARSSAPHLQSGMDEVYALDYEDIIGDLRTRFHYTAVKPETFGWSVADILEKEEKELNQKVSLKKLAPYREEGGNGAGEGGEKGGKGKARWLESRARIHAQQKGVGQKSRKLGVKLGESKAKQQTGQSNGSAAGKGNQRASTPPEQGETRVEASGAEAASAEVRSVVNGEANGASAANGKLSSTQRRRLRAKKRKELQAAAAPSSSTSPHPPTKRHKTEQSSAA